MSTRVLMSPAGKSISKSKYAKEFYLLQSIGRSDSNVVIDSYFRKSRETPAQSNVSINTLCTNKSVYRYYAAAFNQGRKLLKTGDYDIYHHMNFHYRFFNPLLAADLINETPSVIGPAQPPHTVPDSQKKRYLKRNLPYDYSESTLDTLVPIVNIAEHVINRPREVLFKKTLENVDCLIAVNEETAKLYAQYMPRKKIRVIPIGVDIDRFKQGAPAASTDVLSIGKLHRRKGFDVLLKAWAEIASGYPEATLHILGDGAERNTLEKQAAGLNIEDQVKFHGHVDHSVVVERLASARVFVHPTRSEGYGHVRLEAMASACPVVGTNITGAREMVRDGIDGVIVPTDDAAALAGAVSNILDRPDEANRMGQNARDRAEKRFSWRQIGDEYVSMYKKIDS